MSTVAGAFVDRPSPKLQAQNRFLKPGWPLTALFVGFPLWWALGLAQVIFFVIAIAMVVILRRQGSIRVPRGFAFWLLFLLWVAAGGLLLHATAPGTVAGFGLNRLVNFALWGAWYLAITIAMLYVANTATSVSTRKSSGCWGGCSSSRPALVCWPSWPPTCSSSRWWSSSSLTALRRRPSSAR